MIPSTAEWRSSRGGSTPRRSTATSRRSCGRRASSSSGRRTSRSRGVLPHRAGRVRPDAQSVGPGSVHRRLERWLRGCGRLGHGPGGARERHGRLDPGAGKCLWSRRVEAERRAGTSLGPTFGEYWAMLTHEHVVTRTVRDSAAILDCTAGAMPGDPYTAPPPSRPFADEIGADPGRLRIGWRTAMPGGDAPDPECVTAVERTVAALSRWATTSRSRRSPSSTPCRLPRPASSAPSWRVTWIGGASGTASRSPKPMSSPPPGSSRRSVVRSDHRTSSRSSSSRSDGPDRPRPGGPRATTSCSPRRCRCCRPISVGARHRPGSVHDALELRRSAGDLAAAARERRRPSRRRAARGGLRPRGPALPPFASQLEQAMPWADRRPAISA